MISSENKLLVFGLLLVAIITACVQLPDTSVPEVDDRRNTPLETQPASAEIVSTDRPEPEVPQAVELVLPETETIPEVEVDTLPDLAEPLPESMIAASQEQIDALCVELGNKLGSVSVDDCLRQHFHFGGGFSINERPLVVKEIPPESNDPSSFRVFLMGGIHGDEYSSISIIFKWLDLFSAKDVEGRFYWRFAPLVNPDGLLDGQAKRQNSNGVDLNRNFPSLDWDQFAADYWHNKTGRNPRRFPGPNAASEPEVQWVIEQIEAFNPDVIISVHAPYHLLDFDGPREAPEKIGELYLHQLGVYPGSLGNYAGVDKKIPVVTLELPSAGIMPSREQIHLMWLDLVVWLDSADREAIAH